jgi:hypothetical protein
MKRLALVAVLFIGLALSARADFNAGVAAYNRGDYAAAFAEFMALAERGQAKAQFNLGFMYEKGLGAPADDGEAMKWYRKAAEQGHAGAQNNLGVMYETGKGVPQDYVEAYFWYSLAAAQDNDLAVPNLDNLTRLMTVAQREAAQREAAQRREPLAAPSGAVAAAKPDDAGRAEGRYRLQLTAVRSAAAAEREWQRLRRAHGDLLGQLTSSIEPADLGSKGVFYRLRVGPIPDMEAARKLCDALTQRKEACLIVRR